MDEIKITDLYDLNHTIARNYLESFVYPWEALSGIKELILSLGKALPQDEYKEVSPNVWVHHTVKVAPTAFLGAPCIIGPNTEVRHCAFIRGSALIGEDCVIGNSVEIKNAIIFDHCEVPHYNYVGDSILGYHAHMGAGSVTSNVKADRKNVVVKGQESYVTGIRKFGAMLGDYAEIGCNSVLNPGTIIGKYSNVYPLSSVRGIVPPYHIYKDPKHIVEKENR